MDGLLRIEQMFAFICLDDDGTEGIPAVKMTDGIIMPLCGADIERVASLRPIAEMLSRDYKKPFKLVKFTNRIELETIGKED